MKRTIFISRGSVMHIVEGITATIAQHNAGTVTFEQLWASASDVTKLDIWWRSAINDLEMNLRQHVAITTDKFDLQTIGKDYKITITFGRFWDEKLTGVLGNKIQEYLVNTVTAGWLSDFGGLTTADYTAMAAGALADISQIMLQRKFIFPEIKRFEDAVIKSDAEESIPSVRKHDESKATGGIIGIKTGAKHQDNAVVNICEPVTDWGCLEPIRRKTTNKRI